MKNMKICILGSGALGCVYGANLSKKHEVTFICRRQAQADVINSKGITVDFEGKSTTTRAKAVTSVKKSDLFDLVIVLVKGMDTVTAIKNIMPAIGENTIVFTLQNGLGNYDQIASVINPANIVVGTCNTGAYVLEDGHVVHAAKGVDHIGSYEDDLSNARICVNALTECGLGAEIDSNIDAAIWSKLFVNIGANCITALFEKSNEITISSKKMQVVINVMLKEAVEVANAKGLDFIYEEVTKQFIEKMIGFRKNKSSMYQDIMAGRLTEIDFINGAVVREGKKYGIAAPYNNFMTMLIHGKEDIKDIE